MDSDGDTLGLGACCICMGEKDVTTIVMLPVKNVVRGHGWGCVVCALPADGASAVLCSDCLNAYAAGRAQLRLACGGYPETEGRVSIDSLTEPHAHDMTIEH
jgi:hypothetical protein